MTGQQSCPSCGAVLVATGTAPALCDGIACRSSHLLAERFDRRTRGRVLQRLCEAFSRGIRDPELLYLGARYAVSLGIPRTVERFTDALSGMLRDAEGHPAQTYLPVGLVRLIAMLPGEQREALARELIDLAGDNSRLLTAIGYAVATAGELPTPDSNGPLRALAEHARQGDSTGSGLLDRLFRNGDEPHALASLVSLSAKATVNYEEGALDDARAHVEQALLVDGDQPAAIRNLAGLAAEQQEPEACARYHRRFVRLMLWRILRDDGAADAWRELLALYTRIAMATDRAFGEEPKQAADLLRRPGLLAAWIESHSALVWLDTASMAHRTQQTDAGTPTRDGPLGRLDVMRFWVRVFHPMFDRHLNVLGTNTPSDGPTAPRARSALPFDPVERTLVRFAQWSRVGFGLQNDPPESPLFQAVSALVGMVSRLPKQRYTRILKEEFQRDTFRPRPFRRAIQDACSAIEEPGLGRFLEAQDWSGLADHFGSPEISHALSPRLRLFAALGFARSDRHDRGIVLALNAADDLLTDDIDQTQVRGLFRAIVEAAVDADASSGGRVRARLCDSRILKERPTVRDALLEEVTEVDKKQKIHERINAAIAASKELVEQGQFTDARRMIRELPDETGLNELKENLIAQITEVEKRAVEAADEVIRLSAKLHRKGVSTTVIHRIARDNNVEMTNPLHFAALLRAIDKQV